MCPVFNVDVKNVLLIYSYLFLDVTVSGYVSAISPVQEFKKKRKYFDFMLHTKESVKRAICFSPEKHALLRDICKSSSGCQIKKIKYSNDDILINDYSAVKGMDLKFDKKEEKLVYLKGRNFGGKKIWRIWRFLPKTAKLNSRQI